MDVAELATLGTQIVELGTRLNGLKEQRDALNTEVVELEAELRPLVLKHAQIVASLVGTPVSPAPAVPSVDGRGRELLPDGPAKDEARRRVVAYLADAEPGIGALEIASQLRLDGMLVRQIMFEMSHGGRSPV